MTGAEIRRQHVDFGRIIHVSVALPTLSSLL